MGWTCKINHIEKGKKVLNMVPTLFFADRGCYMRILGEMKALANYGYKNIIVTYHNGRDMQILILEVL